MAAKFSDIASALAPSGDVADLTPAELIEFIATLAAVIVDVGNLEHSDEGEHRLKSGPIGDRPSAGNAGGIFIATDEPSTGETTIYVDNGTAWVDATAIDSSRLVYSNTVHSTLSRIKAALDFLLEAYSAAGFVLGSKVLFTPTSPGVLPASGTGTEMMDALDAALSTVSPTTQVAVNYGAQMSLQAAISSVRASLLAIASTAGAQNVGMPYTAGLYQHIQATDTNVYLAIKRLDGIIRDIGANNSSGALVHTTQGLKFFGNDSQVLALSAVLNVVEDILTALPDTNQLSIFHRGALQTTELTPLFASAVINPGGNPDGDSDSVDISCPGAAIGDYVMGALTTEPAAPGTALLTFDWKVRVADNVTLTMFNNSGSAIVLQLNGLTAQVVVWHPTPVSETFIGSFLFHDIPDGSGLGLGNCYVDRFYAHAITGPVDQDLFIEFRLNGSSPAAVTLAITDGNNSASDAASQIDFTNTWDRIDVYAYHANDYGTPVSSEDIVVSCRQVVRRDMSDWT